MIDFRACHPMIYYVATAEKTHTMRTFLDHWAGNLAQRMRIMTYDEVLRAESLPRGTYVLSDLERLLPSEIEILTLVRDQLHAAGVRVLNHPVHTLRRFDLLTKLHALGRNQFRVVRASDRATALRYPVFLREEGEHGGSLTGRVENRRKLDEALAGAIIRGHKLKNLIVIEYCDTVGADGVYTKYSSFMVAGRVVPCHVDRSRQWVVKDTDIVDSEGMNVELTYLETNPHRAWLEETFALAGVDFGRIDYGSYQGQLQVWEINTNPMVIMAPGHYTEIHMPIKRRFVDMIRPAIEAIDTPVSGPPIPIEVPVPLFTRLDFDQRRQGWARLHRKAFRLAMGWAPAREARRFARPLLAMLSPFLTRRRPGSDS